MSTPASPYAAPNSPIASSKRPRVPVKVDLKSPDKSQAHPRRLQLITCLRREILATTAAARRIGGTNDETRVAVALFSPALKEDAEDIKESDDEQTEDDAENEEDEDDVFNPYLFIAGLPPHSSVVIKDKICLPPLPKNGVSRPTLALDLDETLVHCTVEPIAKPDLTFVVTFNGTMYQVYVRKRPYLDYFLDIVSKTFEVVIFTASQKVYADVLLDLLDPEKKLICHRLFRESCLFVQGNYLKDLTVLGRDMKRSILVDNSPHAYGYDLDNGIPIESWFDDPSDTELLKLAGFLRGVTDVDDVRPVIKNHFRSFELVHNATLGFATVTTAPPF